MIWNSVLFLPKIRHISGFATKTVACPVVVCLILPSDWVLQSSRHESIHLLRLATVGGYFLRILYMISAVGDFAVEKANLRPAMGNGFE